jgi:outer membrane lipoprotein LolB
MERMMRIVLSGLLVALLGACAIDRPRPVNPESVSAAMVALPEQWHAVGRVAVKQASEGWSAGFDWQQRATRADIQVRGPLGIGAVVIVLTPSHLRIESGQRPLLELDAPFDAMDSVLQQRLGVAVPLPMLRYWMLGVPDPSAPSVERAGGFEQLEWQVTPTERAAVVGLAGALPTRLDIRHGDTRVRWVIDQWQVGLP